MLASSIRRTLTAVVVAATFGRVAPAVAEEPLAVVVAHDSGHAALTLTDVAAIYRRKRLYWPDGERIVPVNLPSDDQLRHRFSLRVLGRLPEQLTQYWNEMYYHGIVPPQVLESPEAVLRFVASTSNAVGYVPLCQTDRRVLVAVIITAHAAEADADQAACRHASSTSPQK